MTLYGLDGKKKIKLSKGHTFYLKLENGTKLRLTEEATNAIDIFAVSEKEVIATVPIGPRRLRFKSFKDWV